MIDKSDVVVLTTIFDLEWTIAYDFFNSLNEQDFKEFDIFVVNDGFDKLDKIKEIFSKLTIIETVATNSIAKNREKLVNYAIAHYKVAVFCDFDDYFSANRVSLSISKLRQCDIIFNDVSLFRNNKITQKNRFSNDLVDGDIISLDDIIQKNYLGFSNAAINVGSFKEVKFDFDVSLIAVDWYFFSLLILHCGMAQFTNKSLTFYRQHDSNIADIESFNESQVLKELRVKKLHYKQLAKIDTVFSCYLEALEIFSEKFAQKRLNIVNQEQLGLSEDYQAWWSLIQLNVGKY